MTDPLHELGGSPAGPLRPTHPVGPAAGSDAAQRALRESEFRALLEDLEASTEALERSAAQPDASAAPSLHDSWRQAQESFREALDIGERLLEAYREARIDPERVEPPETDR